MFFLSLRFKSKNNATSCKNKRRLKGSAVTKGEERGGVRGRIYCFQFVQESLWYLFRCWDSQDTQTLQTQREGRVLRPDLSDPNSEHLNQNWIPIFQTIFFCFLQIIRLQFWLFGRKHTESIYSPNGPYAQLHRSDANKRTMNLEEPVRNVFCVNARSKT